MRHSNFSSRSTRGLFGLALSFEMAMFIGCEVNEYRRPYAHVLRSLPFGALGVLLPLHCYTLGIAWSASCAFQHKGSPLLAMGTSLSAVGQREGLNVLNVPVSDLLSPRSSLTHGTVVR